MDCDRARQLLPFDRPGAPELDAGDRAALHGHLADCPECAPAHRAALREDERLARAMRAVAVPAAVRPRLEARLLAARRAWWRQVGVAAAVGWTLFGRPAFDPYALAQAAYEQNGGWRSGDEASRQWRWPIAPRA